MDHPLDGRPERPAKITEMCDFQLAHHMIFPHHVRIAMSKFRWGHLSHELSGMAVRRRFDWGLGAN